MADLELSLATTPYDRVQALFTGEVKPEGITLLCQDVPLNEIWTRQLESSEFDISEMSFSFLLRARALGWGYRALPVFHNRNFSYTGILVRLASEIRIGHPEDLKGRRVGVTDYQMSAAVWSRGILQHEFGVKPEEIEWFQGRPDPFIPGESTPFCPTPGVTLHPYEIDDSATMLLKGELDAAFMMGRYQGELGDTQRFQPLFLNAQEEAIRYYRKSGFIPPHHATIVRESILREHPWVAKSLLDAFEKAKEVATKGLYQRPPSLLIFGSQWVTSQRATFGDDPYVYGIAANAKAVDTVQSYSMEQGLTQQKQPWEEFFAAGLA